MAADCYKDKHPLNMYLLGGFTVCETYTVGVICAVLTHTRPSPATSRASASQPPLPSPPYCRRCTTRRARA